MASSRIISIEIKGEGGSYEATINRIIDKNRQLAAGATAAGQQLERTFVNLHSNILPALGRQFAAAFGVGAVVSFFKSVAEGTAVLADLGDMTGLAGSKLATLRLAGLATGQGVEEIATQVVRLQSSLIDATDKGTGPAAAALARLKINAKELAGALADPNKLVDLLTQKLGAVPNVAERNAIAIDLVGRAGGRTATTLVELANNVEKYRNASSLTDEQIKVFDENLDKLAQTWQKVKDRTASATVEILKWFGAIERSKKENLREEMAQLSDQLETAAKKLKLAERSSPASFGLFSSAETRAERQKAAIAAAQADVDKLLGNQKKLDQAFSALDQPAVLPAPSKAPVDPEIGRKQADAVEAAKTALLQLRLANAEAAKAAGDLTVDVRALALALIEQEKSAQLAAAAHNKTLTPALRALIDAEAKEKIGKVDAAAADEKRKEAIKALSREIAVEEKAQSDLAEVYAASAKDNEILNQRKLDEIEIVKQLNDLDAERLGILGKTSEAERVRLQGHLAYLEALKRAEGAQGKDTRVRDAQIGNAQTQLQKLGQVSVDIGRHVGNTLEDIFGAMINGTLKGVDVMKAATGTIGRIVTDIFSQVIKNKLAFELNIFSNLKGLPGQMQNAFASGGGGAGAGGGGGGGFLNLLGGLFGGGGAAGGAFGFGSAGAGVEGPAFANGGFFSGGGASGGGFDVGGLVTGVGGIISKFGGSIGEFLGLTGGTGSLFGPAGALSGVGDALSSFSSALPVLGAITGVFNLVSSIKAGSVGGAIGSSITIAGAVGSAVASYLGYALAPYTFGITAILGLLVSLFAGKPAEPKSSANLNTHFEGLRLGEFGLEVGKVTTDFNAKGLATKKLGDVGKDAATAVENTLNAAVAVLNKLPLEVLKVLDLPGITAAVEAAGSFSIKVRDRKFGAVLNEVMVSIPAKVLNAMAPLFEAGISEELKRLGAGDAGVKDFVKRILPPTGLAGPNQGLIQLTEDSVAAFGNFFDFLNALDEKQKFASAPEKASLGAGLEAVLGARDQKELTETIDRYIKVFQGIFANIDTRRKIAEGLGAAITEGVNGVDAATAFQKFTKGFSDVITSTVQSALVAGFVAQQIQPLITGPVARIQEIFGTLGAGAGPADFLGAQTAAQSEVDSLGTQIAALRPVFDAFRDVVNSITGDVQARLGVVGAVAPAGGGGNVVTVNVFGVADVGEFARKLEDFLSGGTSPASLQ